jgi:hypothetical protein
MKILLLIPILVSVAFGVEVHMTEEHKFAAADLVVIGRIERCEYWDTQNNEFIWKAVLSPQSILKGDADLKGDLHFYYESSKGPITGHFEAYRCPPYPAVVIGNKVKIYLENIKLKPSMKVFYLASAQQLEVLVPATPSAIAVDADAPGSIASSPSVPGVIPIVLAVDADADKSIRMEFNKSFNIKQLKKWLPRSRLNLEG